MSLGRESETIRFKYKCAVPDCNKTSVDNPNLAFHKFPSPNGACVYVADYFGNQQKVDQLTAWLKVLKIEKLTKGKRVCSSHFRKEDYAFPDISYNNKRPLLMKTAVPSCNLPGSNVERSEKNMQRLNRRMRRGKRVDPPSTTADLHRTATNCNRTQNVSPVQDDMMIENISEGHCSKSIAGGAVDLRTLRDDSHYACQAEQRNSAPRANTPSSEENPASAINQQSPEVDVNESDHSYHKCIDLLQSSTVTIDETISVCEFETDSEPSNSSVPVPIDEVACESLATPNSPTNQSIPDAGKQSCMNVARSDPVEVGCSTSTQGTGAVPDSSAREQDSNVQVKNDYKFKSLLKSNKQLSTATGLETFDIFHAIVESMKVATNFKYEGDSKKISTEDRVILTFIKLKQNVSYSFLALIFPHISERHCARIFLGTVRVLAKVMKLAIPWIPKEETISNFPKCFQHYKNVRIILDCTEIFVQRPKELCCQIHMYSQYKNGITIKFLIGISPAGNIIFVSRAYGGRWSDTSIFDQSKLIELLETGDAVMVDKGFLIDEICHKNKIELIRPPFLRNKKQFSEDNAVLTEAIANARIHIERVNQRIKVFGILGGILPAALVPYIEDIVTIACGVVNLSSPIIDDEGFMKADEDETMS